MFAIVKNGEIEQTGSNIRAMFPNVSFPASGPSDKLKQAAGVMDVVDGEQKDQRFYWVTPAQPAIQLVNGVPTRLYVNTPKDLEDIVETVEGQEEVTTKGLKTQWIEQVKDIAGKMLSQTDWMVIRKAERAVDIPADVVAKRAVIVAEADRLEAAIASCADVESLISVVSAQNWSE